MVLGLFIVATIVGVAGLIAAADGLMVRAAALIWLAILIGPIGVNAVG
jgi:hypothetical protein